MIQYKQLTTRSNNCELKARSIAKTLCSQVSTLDSFESNFRSELAAIPRVNTSHCSDWYKIERNGNKIILWHLTAKGDKDRQVAEIIEVNKENINRSIFGE